MKEFLFAFLILVALCVVTCGTGCAVGPFVDPHAKRCGDVWECPDGYICAFPSAGSHAVCMQGQDPRWDVEGKRRRPDGGK